MWGLFSKDPAKDFPYENGERLGQIHLANKTVASAAETVVSSTETIISVVASAG